MKLNRLDACNDWKVVRWCRTQASSHNWQGVIDGVVSETGMSTATPNRSAILCGWMHQGQGGCSQCCCSSTPTRASNPPQECDAWCQVFANWLKLSAIRERPVHRYCEVFGLEAEGQGFVVEVDFKLTLSFLVAGTVFVVLSFSFQVWRYSPAVAMSLLSTTSTACQSPSACMIARSSTYAYFLEMVVGRSEI